MKRGPEELEEGEIPEEQGDNHEEQGDIHKNKKNKPEQELELELAMSPLQNEEDDYEDEQEEMIIAPVEVKSEVDEFINKMVEDVPYVDNIDDDVNKIKSTLDKIAVDTYFPDFLKIINGNNYTFYDLLRPKRFSGFTFIRNAQIQTFEIRRCNNMINTTGTTCGAGSAYPSVAHDITPSF